MSTREITTYEAFGENRGTAKVLFDSKEEMFIIEYFDDGGHRFYTEDFPNKSLRYVEDAAQNWASGIKKLGENVL